MVKFNLNVPPVTSSEQEVFPKQKNIENWIATLPIASSSKTAKLLYKVIKKINRTKAPPLMRFEVTTALISTIEQNMLALEKYYLDVTFPLSTKIKHLAFIRIRLIEELAFAYKLIIQDLLQGMSSDAERKLLPVGIFYAVQRLSDLIYARALVYQLPLNLIWSELHTLYNFAETKRFATMNFKAALGANGEEIEATIKDLYLRALMFVTASPMRLRQREMCALYFNILKWVKVIRVQSITNFTPSATSFIVVTKGDNPPQHSAIMSKTLNEPALELDTGFLIQILQDLYDTMPIEINSIVPGNKRDVLNKGTVRRLIQVWGSVPQRYFARTQLNFELPLAIGINTIYKSLTGQDVPQPEPMLFGPGRLAPGSEIMNLTRRDLGFNSLDNDRSRGLALAIDNEVDSAMLDDSELTHSEWNKQVAKPKSQENEISPYVTLTTLNESVGGYCVDWNSHKTSGAKIGELLGIEMPGSSSTYTLTVIRWIHDTLELGLQVGLQVLSPKVEAVIVLNNTQRHSLPIHCLLIPELNDTKLPASLIASPSAFHTNDFDTVLLLKHGKIERQIRLTELLETSGAFVRLAFTFQ